MSHREALRPALVLSALCAATAAIAQTEEPRAQPAEPAAVAAPADPGPLGELLPPVLLEVGFLGVQLWQWIGLGLLLVVAVVAAWLVVGMAVRLLRPLAARTETSLDDELIRIMKPPARLVVWIAVTSGGAVLLHLAAPVQGFLGNSMSALVILALTWLGIRAVDVGASLVRAHLEARGRWNAIAVLPLGRRGAKVALLAVALVGSLQNLGINVTGLIAGLSIGGLALGLAAQKSIANLFGGVSLAVDQPIRVGDLCRFGDGKLGTVEEIGLRSTRVRTAERTLVTIPNAEFSEIQLENYAARDRIRLQTLIGLRYETSPDQLRHVMAEMRRLLASHPMIVEDRVRFVAFGAHSLDVEVFAYVMTRDVAEFLAVQEDVYLRLMEIVEASGTNFAFPSQTLYLGRDRGIDREQGDRAEEQVRRWREAGELPFPDFGREVRASMRGTAEWPPRGSASAGDVPEV